MNNYNGFIQLNGEWFNVNHILSVKYCDFERTKSIITFVDGNQKVVNRGLVHFFRCKRRH
nr:MAG TPA: hypothetical protein [Caudoviricetes sp.]